MKKREACLLLILCLLLLVGCTKQEAKNVNMSPQVVETDLQYGSDNQGQSDFMPIFFDSDMQFSEAVMSTKTKPQETNAVMEISSELLGVQYYDLKTDVFNLTSISKYYTTKHELTKTSLDDMRIATGNAKRGTNASLNF